MSPSRSLTVGPTSRSSPDGTRGVTLEHCCNQRHHKDEMASLIEAQRPDLAMDLVEQELNLD